jgi:hypothetical protein
LLDDGAQVARELADIVDDHQRSGGQARFDDL